MDSRERSRDQLVGPQGCPPRRSARNPDALNPTKHGARWFYYSVFSLGPIIVIAIAIAGLFFSHEAVTSQVTLKEMMGDKGAQAIEAMLAGASRPAEGALATILGIGALLFAAIGVVVQLKDALNAMILVLSATSAYAQGQGATTGDPAASSQNANPDRAGMSPNKTGNGTSTSCGKDDNGDQGRDKMPESNTAVKPAPGKPTIPDPSNRK